MTTFSHDDSAPVPAFHTASTDALCVVTSPDDLRAEPLPRSESNRRLDIEGVLTSEAAGGFQVLRFNDGELSEILAYLYNNKRENNKRDFGRVRITIERLAE